LRLAKRLLREGQQQRLADVLELSAAFQALAHETEDHREAVDAFLQKRAPQFRGPDERDTQVKISRSMSARALLLALRSSSIFDTSGQASNETVRQTHAFSFPRLVFIDKVTS
jgi:hypothetical protein